MLLSSPTLGKTCSNQGGSVTEKEISIIVCQGPNSEKCKCRCPKSCEHEWTGEWVKEVESGGATIESTTCSRCGMRAIDHALWIAE